MSNGMPHAPNVPLGDQSSWGLLWQRIYCSGCVKELDTVYNYYIEIHHDVGLTYTFYDLESLHWYFPSLVPSLTKI